MTDLAQNHVQARPVAASFGQSLIGVVLAMLVGAAVLFASFSALERDVARDAAVSVLAGEAQALAAKAASQDPSALGFGASLALAQSDAWQVVRMDTRQRLAASGAGQVPGPLDEADKDIYDRAGKLASNAMTNGREGRDRKPKILVSEQGDILRVSAPLRDAGTVVGVVEVTGSSRLEGVAQTRSLWPWLACLAAPVIFGLVFFPLRGLRGNGAALLAGSALATGAGLWAALRLLVGEGATFTRLAADRVSAKAVELAASGGVVEPVTDAGRLEILTRDGGLAIMAGLLVSFIISSGLALKVWRTLIAYRAAYLYVAPAVVGALVLVFFPFLYGVAISFTDTTLVNQGEPFLDRWTGLSNYVAILGDFDLVRRGAEGALSINYQSFYWTLFVTLLWTVTNVALGVSIGLGLALMLNIEGLRGKAIYRVLLILPWAVPNYITALVWKGMFHPQFGVINQALMMFGLEPVNWFDSFGTAFVTGLAANVWLSFPFMMVISLGALQSVSKDMYEAARLEGASGWQQFRDITLPSIQPALIPAVILSVVWTFNMFNVIYLVSGGEPAGANEILITQAYKVGFEQYRYGYSAAYSIVIFVILLLYGWFQVKATNATERVG